ncbi:MAG TPA: radical SAM protein [Thermosulfidibacter takaii]|uniref:Radical SAM protein n=1 Tax=Thermosulfidibacter takaii TaxID=412593 RepID=A0A7C0U6Q4_9BACT|nr:radical SAM protein [Thermosulfidibacter takaii]
MKCRGCGKEVSFLSGRLGYCADCIRKGNEQALERAENLHSQGRLPFQLPTQIPRDLQGVECNFCGNACRIPQGKKGFCGTKANQDGKLVHLVGDKDRGKLHWYHDPLPTNCVAHWVCAGCSSAGYPQYSHTPEAEYGYQNLAVFYASCTFDCLFCQNWSYKVAYAHEKVLVRADELAHRALSPSTSCICFFGGDPSSQILHALATSYEALRNKEGILRICWETNGSVSRALLEQIIHLSLSTGGTIKFDLKAWNPNLHRALCGVDNQTTLSNFHYASHFIQERPDPPLLVASTLLIPGYIDAEEVAHIARFIASCSPKIPYSLLAFHPQHLMDDLPPTPRQWALECLEAARGEGLENVHLGNIHLLW